MFVTCPACGALNQEVGKFCEQCGTKVVGLMSTDPVDVAPDNALKIDELIPPEGLGDDGNGTNGAAVFSVPDVSDAEPVVADDAPAPDAPPAAPAIPTAPSDGGSTARVRFVRLENGVQNPIQSFVVPVGSRMLVGRTDPANGVFPDVDITMWSQRVSTPDGPLYTVHRKQCFVSRDSDGVLWIVDYKEYVGDTMVSPAGSGQFRTIPALAGERESNSEGGIRLEIGDRILMGQAEGMLIFVITQE
jgi:hypothetical protein